MVAWPNVPNTAKLQAESIRFEKRLKALNQPIDYVEVIRKEDTGEFPGGPSTASLAFKIYSGNDFYGTGLFDDPKYEGTLFEATQAGEPRLKPISG